MTFFALDHGEATLLEFPDGRSALVGGAAAGEAPELLRRLKKLGHQRVDMVLANSWSPEHVGGMPAVLSALRPKGFVYNPVSGPAKVAEPALSTARGLMQAGRLDMRSSTPGESMILLYNPMCEIRFVAPTGPMQARYAGDPNCSQMVELSYERVSLLDLGDSQVRHQRDMWKGVFPRPTGRIIHVGAGADTSLDAALLKPLGTRIAVLSVPRKATRRPPAALLAALQKAKVRVYRTDRQGTISISSDGEQTQVKTERR
jgi:competence protein ComEC